MDRELFPYIYFSNSNPSAKELSLLVLECRFEDMWKWQNKWNVCVTTSKNLNEEATFNCAPDGIPFIIKTDVVFAFDVLRHFERDKRISFITNILNSAAKYLVIGAGTHDYTPKSWHSFIKESFEDAMVFGADYDIETKMFNIISEDYNGSHYAVIKKE